MTTQAPNIALHPDCVRENRLADGQVPGRPAIYYDPGGLSTAPTFGHVGHAKCVVIDNGVEFVSSANLPSG